MTSEEIAAIAESAAERAVAKVMMAMNVNISDPHSLDKLRSRMEHLERQHDACETIQPYVRHSLKTAIAVVVTSVVAYVVMQFGWPKP